MTENQHSRSQAADILVVDDTIATLRLLTEILSRAGYQIRPADGPRAALKSALAHPPSLILLDVRMPEIDGFEVCRRLKQDERTRDVPIIFVSALEDTEDRVQGFEVGGVDFISKPVQEAEVLARVNTHLQLRYTQLHLEALVAERTREIAESEAKYRSLVDNSVVGVFISTPDGRILFVNDALVQMYDFDTPEQMIASGALERWQDVKDRDQFLTELQQHGSVTDFEAKTVTHTGRGIHVIVSVKQHVDSFYGMVMDITERKQAEQKLLDSEARFRVTFEQAAVGIAHVALDGRFLRLNQKFCDIVGYSHDEMLARTFQDITHPDDLDADLQYMQQLVAGEIDTYSMEKRYLCKDGEIVWVNLTASLLREPDGEPGFGVAVVEDITERKQADEELLMYRDHLETLVEERTAQLQEEVVERKRIGAALQIQINLFECLLEATPDSIEIIDPDTLAYIKWNKACTEVTGYSDEEFATKNPASSFFDGADLRRVDAAVDQALREGEAIVAADVIAKDGRRFPMEFVLSVARDTEGAPLYLISVGRDVTERKQAEEALRESERLLNEAQHVANVASFERDFQTGEGYWSDELYRLFGYEPRGVPHSHELFRKHVHPDDQEMVTEAIEQALAKGRGFEMDYRFIPRGGEARHGHVICNTRLDDAGKPRWLHGTFQDITERKQAEEALRESELRLELAVASSEGGLWSIDLDPDDPSHALPDEIYLSPRLKGFLGYEDAEFPGSMAAWESHVHSEDLPRLRENSQRFLLGQIPRYEVEYRVRHKDGSVRWLYSTGRVERDEDGQPFRFAGIDWDITERNQAEEALRESEEKYRDLVEKISDVIYSVDAGGMLAYVNPAAGSLLGLPVEQLVGRPLAQFIHPEDLGRVQNNHQALLSGEVPGPAEYRVLPASGQPRWIRVTSQPIAEEGRVTGLQGVVTDITERKAVEAQLEEAAKAAERQRLARELHDSVTQSLHSASLIAETVQKRWEEDPEEGRRGLEHLQRFTQGALAEMRTLLLELNPEALEAQELSLLLRQLAQATMARTHMFVTVTLAGECTVPAEVKVALYRICQEALNNVVKHAGARRVRVNLQRPEACLEETDGAQTILSIRDDGCGFDLEGGQSSGLGIGIMRERARDIGAMLSITSQPDLGTEVLVEWQAGQA